MGIKKEWLQKNFRVIKTKAVCTKILSTTITAHRVFSVIIATNLSYIGIPSVSKIAVKSVRMEKTMNMASCLNKPYREPCLAISLKHDPSSVLAIRCLSILMENLPLQSSLLARRLANYREAKENK